MIALSGIINPVERQVEVREGVGKRGRDGDWL